RGFESRRRNCFTTRRSSVAERRKTLVTTSSVYLTKTRPTAGAEYMVLRVQAPPGPLSNLIWDRPLAANSSWTLREYLCSTFVGHFERRPCYGQQVAVFE